MLVYQPIVFPLNRIVLLIVARTFIAVYVSGAEMAHGFLVAPPQHSALYIFIKQSIVQALEMRLPHSKPREHSLAVADALAIFFYALYAALLYRSAGSKHICKPGNKKTGDLFPFGPGTDYCLALHHARLALLNLIGLFAQKIGDLMIKRLFVLC